MKLTGTHSDAEYKMNIHTYKLNLGVKYVYPKRQIKPIILGGVYLERLKFSNFSKKELSHSYPFPEQLKINSLFQLGLYGGVGFQYKNVKFNVLYDLNTNRGHGKYLYNQGFEYSLCYYFLRLNK